MAITWQLTLLTKTSRLISVHLICLALCRYKQVQEKYRKLVKRYREVVDHNGRSGRQRQTMPFLDELHRLLSRRPAVWRPHGLDMDIAAAAMEENDVFREFMQTSGAIDVATITCIV